MILFALLCGRLPFTKAGNDEDDTRKIRKRVVELSYKPDENMRPSHLQLVHAMLQLKPEDRATIPQIAQMVNVTKSGFAQNVAIIKEGSHDSLVQADDNEEIRTGLHETNTASETTAMSSFGSVATKEKTLTKKGLKKRYSSNAAAEAAAAAVAAAEGRSNLQHAKRRSSNKVDAGKHRHTSHIPTIEVSGGDDLRTSRRTGDRSLKIGTKVRLRAAPSLSPDVRRKNGLGSRSDSRRQGSARTQTTLKTRKQGILPKVI